MAGLEKLTNTKSGFGAKSGFVGARAKPFVGFAASQTASPFSSHRAAKPKSASVAPIDAKAAEETNAKNIAAADLIRKNRQKETTSYSRSLLGG